MRSGRFIGVMSGTSLDGIDVVLATITENMVAQQAVSTWPIPHAIKEEILAICQGQSLTLSQCRSSGHPSGTAVCRCRTGADAPGSLKPTDVIAIGCHGQTVWHEPQGEAPHTLQIGDNNQIAAHTGITVVGDFRRRDMALRRAGAPLVPAFHHALLAHPVERRMVLNIGGIANVSLLAPGQPVRGYDTGPGNMLLDAWIWRQKGKLYDKDAQWASEGKVLLPLLQDMLSDPWFALPAPKSTGREYFNYGWLEQHMARYPGLRGEDVQATLAELTAVTISEQVLLSGGCERLLVCGGGARNPLLMARLAALLPGTEVSTTDEAGISGDDMEALAFAWLAWRTLAGLPGNLPSVTGASEASVLGAIFPANPPQNRS